MQNYRLSEIQSKLNIMGAYPLDVLVVGCTGAGKSTTLNTLFTKEVAKVGLGVDPETMELDSYKLNDYVRFWDSPGLGDGKEKDITHGKKIIDLLYKTYMQNEKKYGWVDLALVIVEGINRDLGTTYNLLNQIIVPNFDKDRILIAINQCDMAMKGRHWNDNEPDSRLLEFLNEFASSIQARVKEATGVDIKKPIYYSALHNYNINVFYDLIIDNIPTNKRIIK
ncbi:GTPase [Campylobacter sp. 2018MI13]|uniref:GTPase family protein n=1 Tax=Campylobacter sp. 2018MI13 TaxID=2836737 RepID=UPI001BDAB8AD|nr:GTPase [Campylobacter sp. 2018MI13]MBT0882641.1 50S ribosome-binding GTPase [Campylobacter sp. 2018MI13]